MTGEIDMMTPAKSVVKELMSIPSFNTPSDALFTQEKKVLKNLKKTIFRCFFSNPAETINRFYFSP